MTLNQYTITVGLTASMVGALATAAAQASVRARDLPPHSAEPPSGPVEPAVTVPPPVAAEPPEHASAHNAGSPDGLGRTVGAGQASWYGPGFHGRRTASGEVFNQNAFTAAHRTLPFGSRVQVINQRTGRFIVVRINDRGPHVRGRIIDLSRASAQAIGVSGAAPVRLVDFGE